MDTAQRDPSRTMVDTETVNGLWAILLSLGGRSQICRPMTFERVMRPNTPLQLTASRARSLLFGQACPGALTAAERHTVRSRYAVPNLYLVTMMVSVPM